jgi:hypothetical protein
VGLEADFVVLNPQATAFGRYREMLAKEMKNVTAEEAFWNKMFLFMTVGDDRYIEGTYVMGELRK